MNILYVSISCAVITLAILIASFFVKEKTKEKLLIPYIVLLVIIVLAYLYKVGEYPCGFNVDEAGSMFDGISIAKYGYDRYLKEFPVYFINYGDGQNALFTYIFAGWYKLLSLFINIDLTTMNINTVLFILRMPTVIYNLIAYLICFFMIKKEYGIRIAVFAMAIMMAMPFSFMHSRFSLESYYLYPTLLIAISMFVYGIRKHSSIYYALSGLFFGICLYTYAISYVILPLLLMVLLFIIIYTKNFNIKNCLAFIIPLVIVAIPIVLFFVVNYFDLPEFKFLGMTITKLPNFRASEISLSNLNRNLLHLEFFKRVLYDQYDFNSMKIFSTIFYLNIPFLILGLTKSLINIKRRFKSKEFCIDYIMIALLVITTTVGLLTFDVNVNKIHAIYIPLIFYIICGYIYLFNKKAVLFRISMIILVINFGLFLYIYFTYNQNMMVSKSNNILELVQESNKINNNKEKNHYYKLEWGLKPVYIALFNDISPIEYQNYQDNHFEYIPENIDMNGIYLVDDCFEDTKTLENLGFKLVKKGQYNLYYR